MFNHLSQTSRPTKLHFKSAHPLSLKKSIPWTQVLCISNTCTETKHLAELQEAFLKRGYQRISMDDQFNHLNHQKQETKKKEKSTQIPLVMTHNQTLPNFRKIVRDKCSLLKTNNKLKNVMKEQPIIAYRWKWKF